MTQRMAAMNFNLGMPLDRELVPVKAKRVVDPNAPKEWHLQRDCIAAIRARQKFDKNLAYMAPGAAQNNLTPAQRGFAKLMGWQSGLADIWLMKRGRYAPPTLALRIVELKLPGGKLSDEQEGWFNFLQSAGVTCDRCDNLDHFLKILESFMA